MSLIGQKLMNYRITEKIGEGGIASVYLATHELLHTKAAIKLLHPSLGTDVQLRARFLKEASTLSGLNHPNIVRVLDFTENENGLFIIMEYVSGLPLDELIKTRTGPIPEKRAYQIFEKILDGFNYAHSRRPAIIHRDIKPSNIIITEDDDPKIIDFGIVKILDTSINSSHTMTGTKIGTPVFMSPEQILGKELDNRSDIYSLGITLFTMVTGRSPFENTLSEFEIQENIIRKPLPRAKDIYPGVSDKTQSIIDKATAKYKEDRFESCNEFKSALQKIHGAGGAPSPSFITKQPVTPKRKKNFSAIVVIVALVMIGLVIYFIKASNQQTTSSKTDLSNNGLGQSNPVNNTNAKNQSTSANQSNLNNQSGSTDQPGYSIQSKDTIKTTSATQSTSTTPTISNEAINEILVNFYDAEASRDFNRIAYYYSDNVTRYYDLNYPSINEIKKRYNSSWNLTSGNTNTVKAVNIYPDGKNIIAKVTLDYTCFVNKTQEYKTLQNIESTFVFDQDGKIKEVCKSN